MYAFTIDNDIYLGLNRSPNSTFHRYQMEVDFARLAWFNLLQGSFGFEISSSRFSLQCHGDDLVGSIGILNNASFATLFLLHDTEVPSFLLEAKLTHLDGICSAWVSRLRYNLAFDIQFGSRFSSVAGDCDGLLEATRTTVRIVCHSDLSVSPWLDRFASPLRSGATATSAYIAEYERYHTLVLKLEDSGYSAICLVDLSEVVGGLFECDYWRLCHGCHAKKHCSK